MSRVVMAVGAVCFFGGLAAAGFHSAIAIPLVFIGLFLALVSWIVLIVAVRGSKKDVQRMATMSQQQADQIVQEARRSGLEARRAAGVDEARRPEGD